MATWVVFENHRYLRHDAVRVLIGICKGHRVTFAAERAEVRRGVQIERETGRFRSRASTRLLDFQITAGGFEPTDLALVHVHAEDFGVLQ